MSATFLQDRPNISAAAAAAARAMIVDGRLPAGGRINEVHLAAKLGVSRTPLREALNRLAAEGAIVARPRHGYFVRPFSVEEIRELYGVRPILDPAALRLSGLPSEKDIDALDRLNRKLAAARDAEIAIALDDEWHLRLVAHCPNRILIEFIENIILRSRRYELALFRETKGLRRATDDHDCIIAALRRGDLDQACDALKHNMESGVEPLIAWLNARPTRQDGGRRE